MQFEFIGLVEAWVEEKDWETIEKTLPRGLRWKPSFAERVVMKGRTGIKKERSKK